LIFFNNLHRHFYFRCWFRQMDVLYTMDYRCTRRYQDQSIYLFTTMLMSCAKQ